MNAASRRIRGVRSASRSRPPGPAMRSPERRTHSSTPICGEVAGCPLGLSALTSDLLQHRRAADPGRTEEHEDDQDGVEDEIRELRREVADRERLGEADEKAAEHGP